MSSSDAVSTPVSNTSQLLQSLAAAQTAGTLVATLPWQSSGSFKAQSRDAFAVRTFTLDEIPGLSQQLRGSLVQHVHSCRVRIRKIPGVDVTYRAIVAALSDFDDPSEFEGIDEYLATYPTAHAEFTLSTATTDNTIELPLVWPIGIGSSVTSTLPPARVPLIVIYITANAPLDSKTIVYELSGKVDIVGIGHLAGHVTKAAKSGN